MDKVTRQCPQTTTFLKRKESRSGIERGPSAYQPNALPLGQTGSLLLAMAGYIELVLFFPLLDSLSLKGRGTEGPKGRQRGGGGGGGLREEEREGEEIEGGREREIFREGGGGGRGQREEEERGMEDREGSSPCRACLNIFAPVTAHYPMG